MTFRLLRSLLPAATLALLPSTLAAQVNFGAVLSGAAETPPVPTFAIGRSWFTLEPGSNVLHYRVETNVAGGTVAHIHLAPAGVAGPIIFPLAGGPAVYQGSTPPLTPAQVTTLYTNGFYVNVHSVAFSTGEVRGQIVPEFRRHLAATSIDQAQEVPPTGSAGTGSGEFVLHMPEAIVTYRVTVTGLSGPALAAHIHIGPPGVNGGILTDILGVGDTWCGTTQQLTAAQVATLLAGGMYVNVHTSAFPNGEVRGQILAQPERFVVRANGAQETPPNGSPFTGFGTYTFDPATSMIAYAQTWNGVGGTAAHIHIGAPGVAGPIIVPLAGPPNGPWVGVGALTPAQVTALFNGNLYTNIHSVAVPTGEIRGILEQNTSTYGWANPTSAGVLGQILRIGDDGPPVLGSPWTSRVTDAFPGAFLGLIVGPYLFLDVGFLGVTGGVLWESPDNSFLTGADGNGCGEITIIVPAVPAFLGLPIGSQWLSLDAGANPIGITLSNATRSVFE